MNASKINDQSKENQPDNQENLDDGKDEFEFAKNTDKNDTHGEREGDEDDNLALALDGEALTQTELFTSVQNANNTQIALISVGILSQLP